MKLYLKKGLVAAMILSVCSASFAEASGIVCKPEVDGRRVICNVTLSEIKENGAVLMITAKGDTDILPGDVYAMDLITETKPAPLSFVMPEGAMGNENQQYSVIIRNGSDREESFDFYYVNPTITSQIVLTLKGTPKTELPTFMQGTTEGIANSAGLASLGVKTDIYNHVDENKDLIWNLYSASDKISEMTDAELVAHLNECIIGGAMNEADAEAEVLMSEWNQPFDNVAYEDMPQEQQTWICDYLTDNLPISLTNRVADVFEEANVLYAFNHARYSDIHQLITDYGRELGITTAAAYKTYQNMSDSKKTTVQEKMVLSLDKNAVRTPAEIVSVFATAVTEANKSNGSQGGGGGTGGGGGGYGGGASAIGSGTGVAINSTVTNAGVLKSFDDLGTASWAEDAILALSEAGVVSGMGDKKFCPQEQVTREQMVKMILLAAGFSVEEASTEFADVASGAWYEPYVANAVIKGIAVGMDSTTFGIGRSITRQDAAVMIYRTVGAVGRPMNAVRAYVPFADEAQIAAYAKDAVTVLYEAGIINGKQDGFAPTETCTRAEAAKMIYDAFMK
ncbi:MAG: S-layer homology domain-containing protein [Ruminococcaceae bacterium]|nr:S-layer homology domain-containing protein [Oscillospiraceae bacterium]